MRLPLWSKRIDWACGAAPSCSLIGWIHETNFFVRARKAARAPKKTFLPHTQACSRVLSIRLSLPATHAHDPHTKVNIPANCRHFLNLLFTPLRPCSPPSSWLLYRPLLSTQCHCETSFKSGCHVESIPALTSAMASGSASDSNASSQDTGIVVATSPQPNAPVASPLAQQLSSQIIPSNPSSPFPLMVMAQHGSSPSPFPCRHYYIEN